MVDIPAQAGVSVQDFDHQVHGVRRTKPNALCLGELGGVLSKAKQNSTRRILTTKSTEFAKAKLNAWCLGELGGGLCRAQAEFPAQDFDH